MPGDKKFLRRPPDTGNDLENDENSVIFYNKKVLLLMPNLTLLLKKAFAGVNWPGYIALGLNNIKCDINFFY